MRGWGGPCVLAALHPDEKFKTCRACLLGHLPSASFPRCWILQVAFLPAANMPPYPLFSGHPNPNASGGDVLYMVSRQHASWYLVQSPTLWMREFLFFVHTQLIPTEPKTLAKVFELSLLPGSPAEAWWTNEVRNWILEKYRSKHGAAEMADEIATLFIRRFERSASVSNSNPLPRPPPQQPGLQRSSTVASHPSSSIASGSSVTAQSDSRQTPSWLRGLSRNDTNRSQP